MRACRQEFVAFYSVVGTIFFCERDDRFGGKRGRKAAAGLIWWQKRREVAGGLL